MPENTPKHARRWNESAMSGQEPRSEYSKDFQRILYSTAFRRLGGVTQVVASNEIALFHNRLTHSLKTAQVGADLLAKKLLKDLRRQYPDGWRDRVMPFGGLDPRVVRAACMAHDLGHPPFGHIAEQELQAISRPDPQDPSEHDLADGFEGNAQSFRIVTRLAFRELLEDRPPNPALNLTKGTLAAMLKYPWSKNDRPPSVDRHKPKWGFYDSERHIAKWLFDGTNHPEGRPAKAEHRNIEAQVMDWADDISYAVHDIEDFYRAGVIPLDVLYDSSAKWDEFLEYAWDKRVKARLRDQLGHEDRAQVDGWLDGVRDILPPTPYDGSCANRVALHKFASTVIMDAVKGTSLGPGGLVEIVPKQLAIIETLKQLTWYYVIDGPALESIQRGQRYLIRSLFEHLVEWVDQAWDSSTFSADAGSRPKLPARLVDYLEVAYALRPNSGLHPNPGAAISRAVIDYIVSLTEVQAVELHAQLTGRSARSMLDTWLRN